MVEQVMKKFISFYMVANWPCKEENTILLMCVHEEKFATRVHLITTSSLDQFKQLLA